MFAGYKHFSDEQLFTARYPMRSLTPHLARSLWQNSRQARCLGLLLVSCLPLSCGNALRNVYRRCKLA